MKTKFVCKSILVCSLLSTATLVATLAIPSFSRAQAVRSDFPGAQRIEGWKFPNSPEEGSHPVHSWVWAPNPGQMAGFTELIPYVLASPDQEDAGSCLYMSLTGIVEWWLAKLNPAFSRNLDGPVDLSERWLMSVASDSKFKTGVNQWRTDSIRHLNNVGKGVLNVSYRFTKGHYRRSTGGDPVKVKSSDSQASYGTSYNWIDERSQIKGGYVPLPKFDRDILFADPEKNQWNVGVMPDDIIERVKEALTEKRAPVQVLYNHFGYWHALVVLGFDDNRDTMGCEFIEKSREYFRKNPKYKAVSKKLERSIDRSEACNRQGVFYVRDSIYGSTSEPDYVYDPDHAGSIKDATGSYSRRIVMLEYSWLKHLANHAIQIYPATP